jgi:hypothetical protein
MMTRHDGGTNSNAGEPEIASKGNSSKDQGLSGESPVITETLTLPSNSRTRFPVPVLGIIGHLNTSSV